MAKTTETAKPYSREEAADYLGVSFLILGYYVSKGLLYGRQLPNIQKGQAYEFSKAELDRFKKETPEGAYIYTLTEAAEYLKIPFAFLYYHFAMGHLPDEHVPGVSKQRNTFFFLRSELDKFKKSAAIEQKIYTREEASEYLGIPVGTVTNYATAKVGKLFYAKLPSPFGRSKACCVFLEEELARFSVELKKMKEPGEAPYVPPDGQLTIKQAAKLLGVSRQTVHKAVKDGKLSPAQEKPYITVLKKDLDIYMVGQGVEGDE
jgi:transposase